MNDTIAAISTALGVGAISIIRVSGKESISIVNQLFKGKDLTKVNSHTIHYGHIIDQEEIIDEVLVSIMKAPKTFTCEDVVEINCHGGITTTHKILELLLRNGARLAEPGEFTKRAFLNGRIDLVKAESVMDLINVKSEAARKLAIQGLEGHVSKIIRDLRQKLLEIIASIEVNIDYPEYEDIEVMTNEKLLPKIKDVKQDLKHIIDESESGQIIKEGIKTIIVGRPNVGKSSLLNRLINENKAIVTEIEGTTRDTVEGILMLDGIQLQIIDTAGIRETDNLVEKIGVDKSIQLMDEADLVLVVLNNNEELNSNDWKIIDKANVKTTIIVINKNDLSSKIDRTLLKDYPIVEISVTEDQGIDQLKNKIKEMFNLSKINQKDYNYLSNVRQISLAKNADKVLNEVMEGINQKMPIDMVEIDLKNAWEILGEIIGETYTDELLDQLFSQFCLGK